MSVTYVSGDVLLTQAEYIAFGHNVAGRTEMGAVETALMQRYPAPFSSYSRQCNQGKLQTGTVWLWTESQPKLAFMIVRASSVGATRIRYVESIMMSLARDHMYYNIKSLALWRIGQEHEWAEIKPLVNQWLGRVPYPVIVYEDYQAGVKVAEGL